MEANLPPSSRARRAGAGPRRTSPSGRGSGSASSSTTAGWCRAGPPSTAAATPPRSSRWCTSRSWPASASPAAATPRACPSSPRRSSTAAPRSRRQRYALPTLRAEISWCLGMSEPNAGSDLAGLRTRAELHGDRFVVNGQKVWTSGAHDSDYCFCFVRTDPDAAKHAGISVLIIDMKTPGIETRPIAELTDREHADFNEVFFTDVEVPAENLVGELHHGWSVAGGSLAHERGMLWINEATGTREDPRAGRDHRHHPAARRTAPRRRPRVPRPPWPGPTCSPRPSSSSATGASPSSPRARSPPSTRCSSSSAASCAGASPSTWARRSGPTGLDLDAPRGAVGGPAATTRPGWCTGSSASPAPSPAGPRRSSATSSPSACSACPALTAYARRRTESDDRPAHSTHRSTT